MYNERLDPSVTWSKRIWITMEIVIWIEKFAPVNIQSGLRSG